MYLSSVDAQHPNLQEMLFPICNTCNIGFHDEQSLKQHMDIHVNQVLLVCSTCTMKFFSEASLEEHMLIHREPLLNVCSICNIIFPNQLCLQDHMHTHTIQTLHVCNTCEKGFCDEQSFQMHLMTHTLPTCLTCSVVFIDEACFQEHLLGHTEQALYKCNKCDTVFSKEASFLEHVLAHSASTQTLSIETDLIATMNYPVGQGIEQNELPEKSNIPDDSQTCMNIWDTAKQVDTVETVLQEPLLTHTTIKLPVHQTKDQNELSEESVSQDSSHVLKKHLSSDSGGKTLTCELCNKEFRYLSYLKRHLKRQHKELCKASVYQTKDQNELSGDSVSQDPLHVLNKRLSSNSGEETHTCQFCNKEFGYTSSLKRHLKRQHKELCEASVYQTKDQNELSEDSVSQDPLHVSNKHLSSDSGEETHTCQFCNKEFRYTSSLKRHLKMHKQRPNHAMPHEESWEKILNSEKPLWQYSAENLYVCNGCKNQFVNKGSLRNHLLRNYRGESGITDKSESQRSYECKVCNMKFSFKCLLKEHLRIRAHAEPYVCEHCNKEFYCKSSLNAHLDVHIQLPTCKVCKKRFAFESTLEAHMFEHTEEINSS